MKEIETRLPLRPKDITKGPQEYLNKLKYLLTSPNFFKQVMSIREKFNLPAYGVKGDLKNKKKFFKIMYISYDSSSLKSLNIKGRSKQKEFQSCISKLMRIFDLPERFRQALTTYAIYNNLPSIGIHISRCPIRIYADNGEPRLFIEIFGDTKKQDIIKAWKDVEEMKIKYKVRGEHLFRYRKYYMTKMKLDGLQPISRTGESIDDIEFNQVYCDDNIDKWRHKRYQKRHNSK